MPAVTVDVSGFSELYQRLNAIPGAIQAALNAAAPVLAKEGTEYWRSLVTVRTGRMRSALSVQIQPARGGINIVYFVQPRGFYYRFQRDAERWQQQLVAFISGRAPGLIRAEFEAALRRI